MGKFESINPVQSDQSSEQGHPMGIQKFCQGREGGGGGGIWGMEKGCEAQKPMTPP